MTVGFRARCSRIPSVSKARRRRQDGIRMERESSDIKSSRRRRTKVEALNSIQIASFLLFIGTKMQRRREAMRTETFWPRSTFKKDDRGEPEGCSNGILI